MRLRVEYLTPADCRQAYDYWRTHLSAAHRPTNLLQVELPQSTTTPDQSPPVCSRSPDPEKEEDVDHRRLHMLVPHGQGIEDIKEEYRKTEEILMYMLNTLLKYSF